MKRAKRVVLVGVAFVGACGLAACEQMDRTLNSVDRVTGTADRTLNTADRAESTANRAADKAK